jgi:sulfate-transporting ATPase
MQWELQQHYIRSYALSALCGVAFSVILGIAMQNIVMRRLGGTSPLLRLISTLGLLILLQSIATLLYGDNQETVQGALPTDVWDLGNGILVTSDRVYLVLIALVVTVVLWLAYRFTNFGRATTAVADNRRAAAALGLSPNAVATGNWAIGSGLAGIAAILLVPIQGLSVNAMTQLLLPVVAAALIGGFASFPLTCLAGLLIGVLETELDFYYSISVPGLAQSVPFIAIVLVLVVRGRSLPLRDYLLQRMPAVGSGRVRPVWVVVLVIAGILIATHLNPLWTSAMSQSLTAAIILISVVVLTGYAGQLSLAQVTIAGFAAWVAGRFASNLGVSFLPAMVIGILATIPLAVLFAITAIRTRGVNLAIATLGLGSAIELMILDNTNLTGGDFGISVKAPSIAGFSFDPIADPGRYTSLCVVFLAIIALIVANVRRGRSGRRLLAVRANERAAAALGISVPGAKLYAFALATGIAAVGGILMAFQNTTLNLTSFTTVLSITFIAFIVIGSVGYIAGGIAGSILVVGGIGSQIGNTIFNANSVTSGFAQYLSILSGAVVIQVVMQDPDGLAAMHLKQARILARLGRCFFRHNRVKPPDRMIADVIASVARSNRSERTATVPRALEVRNITVRYGAVTAVDNVSLMVRPGEIVGLIGPNGAGKSSLIDAVTGFSGVSAGEVVLDGESVNSWNVHRRARGGLSRSFQSLELFDDLTVLDNLRTASDSRDKRGYLLDLIYPRNPELPATVLAAIDEFNLAPHLGKNSAELSHGDRRLLAIARAVAIGPSILLLDEPAAGLTEVESAELGLVVRRLATDWGLGILIVEHDVELVLGLCDRVVVLNFGKVICEGSPSFVRHASSVIEAYLGESTVEEVSIDEKAPARDVGQTSG